MKAWPIIFSAPMVRAELEGRKTMTRRLAWRHGAISTIIKPTGWQKVKPGDLLWVRESFVREHFPAERGVHAAFDQYYYRATDADDFLSGMPWRSPIHLPRAGSRLTLKVTAVKIERLQAIGKADVIAEGISERDGVPIGDVHAGWHEPYATLWASLHGPASWDANPEVVALTFQVIRANVDDVLKAAA